MTVWDEGFDRGIRLSVSLRDELEDCNGLSAPHSIRLSLRTRS
jgi:hypothetical protein